MKRLGIIGCGRIGGPVITFVQAGKVDNCTVLAVLARHERSLGDIRTEVNADVFFDQQFDLIIDTATTDSLKLHGVRALKHADVWTVNGAALADADFYRELESSGKQYGHRLRVLSGAIAGLDGVAMLAVDEAAKIEARIEVAPSSEGRKILFEGSVRDAAKIFPDGVNVAVAAGLAGVGVDNTHIQVIQPDGSEDRNLALSARSIYGQHEINSVPKVRPDMQIHAVAACIIAALRRENKTIWVG